MKHFITISTIALITTFIFFILYSNKAKFERIKTSMKNIEYKIKEDIKPLGLDGISDDQINDHWKLYQGYVNNVNKLNEELKELTSQGKANSLLFADRRQSYGFEYNGMILHEYYFKNLTNKKNNLENNNLKKEIEITWGSFNAWLEDFKNTGKTRGIGWAILYADPKTGQLINCFIHEHQNGIISDFKPILVMDVWEHAYMVDHKADGRGNYIEAFIKNINWEEISNRYKAIK